MKNVTGVLWKWFFARVLLLFITKATNLNIHKIVLEYIKVHGGIRSPPAPRLLASHFTCLLFTEIVSGQVNKKTYLRLGWYRRLIYNIHYTQSFTNFKGRGMSSRSSIYNIHSTYIVVLTIWGGVIQRKKQSLKKHNIIESQFYKDSKNNNPRPLSSRTA